MQESAQQLPTNTPLNYDGTVNVRGEILYGSSC